MSPSSLIVSLALLIQAPTASLKYDAPKEWTRKPSSSSMRLADFALPRAEGDAEDASLTLYFFGGQGGAVQANLDRWVNQMAQPDGRASKDLAKTSALKTGDFALTVIDLPGTYVAETSPGSPERYNKPGFHLRAAVVEGRGGPYFVKLVGPAKTVAKWDSAVQAFFKSLSVE